ncbi:methyl-accepting chemotaxis protein [Azotobacter beijerinckii]|uniref:methyl-accepting chemotaxis protein n=1 Tax=Azotobacter beijerinckii TaxID=170623 RepID=UPI002953C9BB|nr:methyl-accepting chemotaxis protein [Azotobacter beijerinckii]MDV7212569.1 methyl-accepting chemotaxis protein [Azotobacter beijerinckii]
MQKHNTDTLWMSLRSSAWLAGFFVILIVSIILLFAIFTYLNTQALNDQQYITHAGELRVLSQRIATNAGEASAGNGPAFALLKESTMDFEKRWDILKNGDKETGLPPVPFSVQETMNSVQVDWETLKTNSATILASQKAILSLHAVAMTLTETVPQLQAEYEKVVESLVAGGASATQVALAQRQALLAERILASVRMVLEGGKGAIEAADRFSNDAGEFGLVLNAMRNGNPARGIAKVGDPKVLERLTGIAELFQFVSGSVDEILEASPELLQVHESVNAVFSVAQVLLDKAMTLSLSLEGLADERELTSVAGYVLVILMVAAIVMIALVMVQGTRRRLLETAEKNERNQAAILRLLDEIADLADGDLTVAATVTEDFTGAIADSINYSIDQLRELVATINQTALQVAGSAQESQSTAMHLAEASEHQAQEIAGASAAVNEMAVSIDQVSANAAESSAVAERSVAIANKGNEVVHNTITGMDNIREQIQDTSKRIKRLGESSQEIGDIVSLINDIADQTNILALNAAIQAAMAGDAGRGFAVVADEVQRLAERSSAATKQIEALVKTIQTDTNEAVISMEQTTTEVVRGARLAQDAGVALEEIERVSKTLAALIQNISNAARQQASSAGHISNTMFVIQEITSQTSAGTSATAMGIGNLAKLASDMRKSVSGFTLPETADTL